jgi:hypothetical protein
MFCCTNGPKLCELLSYPLYALYEGAVIGLPDFQLGVAWFIPTLYVPLLLVSHGIVFWFLLRAAPSTQAGRASAGL